MNLNSQILGDTRAPRRGPRRRHHPNDGPELDKIAATEGWYSPPSDVKRVRLRGWQQVVFWGLRIYIVAMLVVMTIGFAHVVISP